jgi:hypothetical protein
MQYCKTSIRQNQSCAPKEQKFFGSFFQKRTASFLND